MRRTQRLFALAEYLRGRRTGVTTAELADRFGVTVRTIFHVHTARSVSPRGELRPDPAGRCSPRPAQPRRSLGRTHVIVPDSGDATAVSVSTTPSTPRWKGDGSLPSVGPPRGDRPNRPSVRRILGAITRRPGLHPGPSFLGPDRLRAARAKLLAYDPAKES